MRNLLIWVGRLALALMAIAVALLFAGPVETVNLKPTFDAASIGSDIDAWLAAEEARFKNIVPGTAKQVIWAGAKGKKTALAVVYLHGFSATSAEIRPVPDQVAQALGANLFYTRLTGHGQNGPDQNGPDQNGAALGAATPEDWINDTAEALAIGRRLGDKVLVIATSTGGTLAAIAAVDPDMNKDLAGIVMLSPNFRMKPWQTRLLDLGFGPVWVPLVAGKQITFTPATQNDATYWTNSYPISALFHTAALVRAAQTLDLTKAKTPLLLFYSLQDQVVDEVHTLSYLKQWAGPTRVEQRQMAPGDDAGRHVIAGDIRSPSQTRSTVDTILAWAKTLTP